MEKYNDLTKYMPRLRKLFPFFLPKKMKDGILNIMFYVLSL